MISKEKSRLREKLLSELKSFIGEERIRQNQEIQKKFLALPEFATARTIGFFASEEFEVATDELIARSLVAGKRVFLPRIKKHSNRQQTADSRQQTALEFHEIKNLAELEIGEFGIRAPREDSPKIEIEELDLLVVPGIAFTKNGERLGRGGGFFDRVLKKFEGVSVGLAFDFQILEKVPMEEWDERVGRVLTGD